MRRTIEAAILGVVLMSGPAWAECPAAMAGQHVELTGTVEDHVRNPSRSAALGEWLTNVNVPDGQCAGHVEIRSAERPACRPGATVIFSGKVVTVGLIGKRTAVESDSIACQPHRKKAKKQP